MRPDEFEQALREAAAAQAPVEDARDQVIGRVRRRRRVQWVAAVAVVVFLSAGALAWAEFDSPEVQVDTAAPTATTPETSTVLDPDVALCFPQLSTASAGVDVQAVTGLPDGLPPLLVLSASGELWVIDDSKAVRWTTDPDGSTPPLYLWARWAEDGSIYASRLSEGSVVLDRLTAPGEAEPAVDLPYTISADAPDGWCPIDGYLASFTIEANNVWLVRHIAGPVPHGCPAMPTDPGTTWDPWRCSAHEAIGFEVRRGTFDAPGQDYGLTMGGSSPLPIAGDSADTGSFVVSQDGSSVVVNHVGPPMGRLDGATGTAFELSPDGLRLAYSPDGDTVMLDGDAAIGDDDMTVWVAPDPVESITWTDGRIAIGHGGHVTLVRADGSEATELAGFAVDSVVTLDWGPQGPIAASGMALRLPVVMAEVCAGGDFGSLEFNALPVGVYDDIPQLVEDTMRDVFPDGPPGEPVEDLASRQGQDVSTGWVYSLTGESDGVVAYLSDGSVIAQWFVSNPDGKWMLTSRELCATGAAIFRPDLTG